MKNIIEIPKSIKCTGLLTSKIILILLLCNFKSFGQSNPFKPNAIEDTKWIKELINENRKQEQQLAKDSADHEILNWVGGKVIYSADNQLRVAQLIRWQESDTSRHYSVTIQYLQHGKLKEKKLEETDEVFNFVNYPICHIYLLPDRRYPSYLILSAKHEKRGNDKDTQLKDFFNSTTTIDQSADTLVYYAATTFTIGKDSLIEKDFGLNIGAYNYTLDKLTANNSLDFESVVQAVKDFPKPYLEYDTTNYTLKFQRLYDAGAQSSDYASPYLTVSSGSIVYRDTMFVLEDIYSDYYPSLGLFTKTLISKNYKIGPYLVKGKATLRYEEVGESVLPILNVTYKINSKTIEYEIYGYTPEDDTNKLDIMPDCRLQKDGSLIILVNTSTTPNRRGRCGGAEYGNSEFWQVKKNSIIHLFSYSWSSCDPYTEYRYSKGRSEVTGRMRASKTADVENYATVTKNYWKNASTYIFEVDDSVDKRNYYLRFNTANLKHPVSLHIGKTAPVKHRE